MAGWGKITKSLQSIAERGVHDVRIGRRGEDQSVDARLPLVRALPELKGAEAVSVQARAVMLSLSVLC